MISTGVPICFSTTKDQKQLLAGKVMIHGVLRERKFNWLLILVAGAMKFVYQPRQLSR